MKEPKCSRMVGRGRMNVLLEEGTSLVQLYVPMYSMPVNGSF